jgi:hypothetical protein
MKLESLKSSKFEAFKGSELQNSFKVLGGRLLKTTWTDSNGGKGCDTEDTKSGVKRDWTDSPCGMCRPIDMQNYDLSLEVITIDSE